MKLNEYDEELGDWRIGAIARIAQDIPAAYEGGPSHKAGAPFTLVSRIKLKNGGNIGITLPSATAMALDIASKESEVASELLRRFIWSEVITPEGDGHAVLHEDTSELFDFFQKCMVVATFSYQALEVFCNHSIERHLKSSIMVKRRNKSILLSPDEIERQLSTCEKLCQILPSIYNVPTPKGKAVWEPYKNLKMARDASIHLKSKDQKAEDESSLYYQFINGNFVGMPIASGKMIHYFIKGSEPRWLIHWLNNNSTKQ